jgi:hypothetical protein
MGVDILTRWRASLWWMASASTGLGGDLRAPGDSRLVWCPVNERTRTAEFIDNRTRAYSSTTSENQDTDAIERLERAPLSGVMVHVMARTSASDCAVVRPAWWRCRDYRDSLAGNR